MYHIYNRNTFVCIIPSITTIGLFGELTLSHAPPFVTKLRFYSYWVCSDEPTSGSHNRFRPQGRRQLERSLLLPHTIVSSREFRQAHKTRSPEHFPIQ